MIEENNKGYPKYLCMTTNEYNKLMTIQYNIAVLESLNDLLEEVIYQEINGDLTYLR